MKIQTKFDIDDAVYTVSEGDVTKRIIKTIRVNEDGDVEYGFEKVNPCNIFYTYYYNDKYSWFDEDDVFETKKEACASEASRKAELVKQINELKRQLDELDSKLDELDC